jgi:predicted nucleic acid-binding protein
VILADTSVWADHFNRRDPVLMRLLSVREVVMHPFVMGELAVGRLPDRPTSLTILRKLPVTRVARHEEVLQLIEDWELFGCGIGFIDAHLLAAVLVDPNSRLWTRDKALLAVARQLSVDAGLR